MKARTVVIYQGKKYESDSSLVTQDEVAAMKAYFSDNVGEIGTLSFDGADGVWYCFPRRVLDESILCVEVVESATVPEAGAEAEAGGECP